jgi:hypothetical protein
VKGLRKLILIVLSAALGFVTVLATSQPAAAAYSFNRTAARDYAYTYSADGLVVRNGSYNSYSGNDCANFASQALFAGNQRKVPAIWDFTSKTNFTTSWINVDALSYTMQSPIKLHRAVYYQTTENGGYTSASLGDIYMYSTDGGASFTHMTVSTGWGSFPTHSDPYKTSMTYSSVTGGSGDWMNGHTREREKAPWDIGYWEAAAVDRPNYMTIILHFYDSYSY